MTKLEETALIFFILISIIITLFGTLFILTQKGWRKRDREMQCNEIFNAIKNDDGVLLYGYTLSTKGGENAFNEISSKLRAIGRLILSYRKVTGVSDACAFSLIDPGNWDNIILAVTKIV